MKPGFFNFKVFVLPEGEAPPTAGYGQGQKGLLVIYAPGETPTETLNGFLNKILQAIKYDLERDAITYYKTPQHPLSLADLVREGAFQHVLLFGITPAQIGLNLDISTYEPTTWEHTHILPADGLEAIYRERQAGGKEKSARLWAMLKQTFLAS